MAKKKTGRVGRQIRRAVGIVSRMIDTRTQSFKRKATVWRCVSNSLDFQSLRPYAHS